MAGPIKLFQNLEIVFQHMGILPSGQNYEQNGLWKRTYFILSIALYICASVSYFAFEAETIGEYTESFYMYSAEMMSMFFLLTYIRKLPEILELIDEFEAFFQKSK